MTDTPAIRDGQGRFVPGVSGNPTGRPAEEREVLRLAREASPKAISRLVSLIDADDQRISIMASNSVLDRAIGKPKQVIAGSPDDPPIPIAVLRIDSLTDDQRRALASIKLPGE